MEIEKQCIMCEQITKIEISEEQFKELISEPRRHIQNILPTHTPAERELFISGICGSCFDRMFEE